MSVQCLEQGLDERGTGFDSLLVQKFFKIYIGRLLKLRSITRQCLITFNTAISLFFQQIITLEQNICTNFQSNILNLTLFILIIH